jgi:hypothetical protein
MTKSTRQYIDGGKSADLHRDYVSGRKWKYAPRGNYVMYHKIFTEFSISFFTLKKDQCELCEAFKTGMFR